MVRDMRRAAGCRDLSGLGKRGRRALRSCFDPAAPDARCARPWVGNPCHGVAESPCGTGATDTGGTAVLRRKLLFTCQRSRTSTQGASEGILYLT